VDDAQTTLAEEEPVEITEEVIAELKAEVSADPVENFYKLAKKTKQRVRNKWDSVYGITGEEGCGKSTLGIQFGKACSDDKVPFDLAKNIIYNPDRNAVREAIINLPRYSVVDVDEAIKMLYKLQWFSDMQIFINIIYALCRRENKVSLLIMPRFKDFNEYFRNHRIKLWIHIIDRGLAVVFTKHWSPFIEDPWLMKDNQRAIDRMMKDKRTKSLAVDNSEKIRILRKSPNYLMEIAFDELTQEEEDRFEQLRKEAGVYDEEYSITKWEKVWRERFYDLIEYVIENRILTYQQLAEITQFDAGSLRGFVSDIREKKNRSSAGSTSPVQTTLPNAL